MRKLICSSFYKLPKLSKSMSNQFYMETSAPVKHSKHASNCLLFCISDKMSTQRVECRTSDEQQLLKSEEHTCHLSETKKCAHLFEVIIEFCLFFYFLLLLKILNSKIIWSGSKQYFYNNYKWQYARFQKQQWRYIINIIYNQYNVVVIAIRVQYTHIAIITTLYWLYTVYIYRERERKRQKLGQ